jgi:hypothetical protein
MGYDGGMSNLRRLLPIVPNLLRATKLTAPMACVSFVSFARAIFAFFVRAVRVARSAPEASARELRLAGEASGGAELVGVHRLACHHHQSGVPEIADAARGVPSTSTRSADLPTAIDPVSQLSHSVTGPRPSPGSDLLQERLERSAFRLNRHPGLDPGSTFLKRLRGKEKGGCRIKSGMTRTRNLIPQCSKWERGAVNRPILRKAAPRGTAFPLSAFMRPQVFRREPPWRLRSPDPPHAAYDNETSDHLLSVVERWGGDGAEARKFKGLRHSGESRNP